MSLGPIELLVVKFPGNQFRGEITPHSWSWLTMEQFGSSSFWWFRGTSMELF